MNIKNKQYLKNNFYFRCNKIGNLGCKYLHDKLLFMAKT